MSIFICDTAKSWLLSSDRRKPRLGNVPALCLSLSFKIEVMLNFKTLKVSWVSIFTALCDLLKLFSRLKTYWLFDRLNKFGNISSERAMGPYI